MRAKGTIIQRIGVSIAAAVAWIGAGAVGCGGEGASPPVVSVDLFGWSESGEFVDDLSEYPDAQVIDVKLTQPSQRKIVASSKHEIANGGAELPELTFGEGLRLDFDLIDGDGDRIATAATSQFALTPDTQRDLSFQGMAVPYQAFSPVGAEYCVEFNEEGECQQTGYETTDFDGRGFSGDAYPGRVGHRAVRTEQDNVLVVGGGSVGPHSPSAIPTLSQALDDLQLFEPGSGYTTDLSWNDSTGARRADGADRLSTARAYHTLTAIGEDRYLVVGGLTRQGGETVPTDTIELIDLTAEPGSRVTKLTGGDEMPLSLEAARAYHTATYRPSANQLVVAGGVGAEGSSDVLASIEVIDLEAGTVQHKANALSQPRVDHAAVLMEDRDEAVWVVGGRHGDEEIGALASTDILAPCSDGGVCGNAGPDMQNGRYDFGVARADRGLLAVCGGYTAVRSNSGDPSNTCEVGRFDEDEWRSSWQMMSARGGPQMIPMTQSRDLVVIGGRDGDGETVESTTRMVFRQNQAPPYRAESLSNSMFDARYNPTVTRLSNGLILLTGGQGEVDGEPAALQSLELYNPADVVRAGATSSTNETSDNGG